MIMRRNIYRSLVYAVLSIAISIISSCQWLPEVGSVRLSESSVTLKVGGSKQLTAIVEPAAAEYERITWTSSDPSVVSVANGQLSARKLGTATITASTEGVTSSPCTVTVEATKVTGVSINKYSLELTEGESASLIATVSPSNATDPTVFWSSSDRNVATVSGGHVSAVSAGNASITVRTNDGGYTATCEVTVKAKFIPVSGVTISSSTLSLKPGETSQLTVTVAPSNATNKDVSWSSSDTSVATVASDGTVTAVVPGTATITVTTADQGKSATCLVTVNAIPVSKITLSNTSLTLTEGDSSQLTATVAPSNATNKAVSWSSSDTSVAMVADDGTVTAKSAGTATITCSSANGAVKATCQVTVNAKVYPVTGVSLGRTSLTLTEGESSQLVATVSPSNATNKSVDWSSSNSSVASVASDGTVTAKAAGSATITCTTADGSKKATCTVSVTAATISVTGVSLNRSTMSLVAGSSGTLTATVSPSNATNTRVSWSSSNTSVATVSSSGVVTAKAAGTASVTVTTSDGSKTASCTVRVTNATVAVTGVYVSPTSLSLTVGGTHKLTSSVSPSNATNTSVSWTSSNSSVATVASDGTVTAKAAGSATITCTTSDGAKKATCSVSVKAATVSVSSVSLDRTSMGLVVGSTGTLKATINPSNATNQGVTWSSNNTSVATVSSSGVVTAKAVGSATITVRTDDGGKTATCTVTVSNATVAVTGVSVSPTSLSLTAGETYRLTPTVSPSNATNTGVTWTSSNTSIATVASDGTVSAKAAGSATIICTTLDGSMKATCSVTVTAPGPTLSFIPQKVINGMKGFEAVSYVYQPLEPPSFMDDKNESWVRNREIYSECVPVVLTYNVSPSSFSFDNSFLYSFSYLDVSTRAYSSEDFTITPHFNSYYNGRLEVVADIIGKEAYDGHMTTFALEVAKNRVTYTSDYAAVSTISMIPFISGLGRPEMIISGLPSSIGSVWTSEIDRSSSDIVLDYTEGIDLRTKTVISVADVSNSSKVRNMTASEMEDAGLSVVYEVVKNYKVGLPAEDQGRYADLSGSELWPCHYGNIPTGGRTPIVRVKLMHNEDVIDVAYHKVYINFPTSVSVTGVSFDQTSLSLEEGKTATLTATVSPSNATNKAVNWSSSNTSVATVSSSGVVTAKAAGSAIITCTTEDGAKKATCAVTVTGATTGTYNGHEWVDLGLPSGVKWAKTNVGSTSSYYAGEYYAWGEISVKNTYEESNYKWLKYVRPNVYSLTKYCTNSSYGTKDGKTTLESSDDIASSEWGGKWRMPTKENFEELLSYCTWSLQTSGTKGYKVTSKVNGNSIFLPVCGSWSTMLSNDASLGEYWTSSTPGNKDAYMFEFNMYTTRKVNTCYRTYGLNVRPVIM